MSSIIAFDVSKDELVGVRMHRSGRVVNRYVINNTRADIGAFLGALTERIRFIGRSLLLEAGRDLSRADLSPSLPHLRTATGLVNMAASIKRRRSRFATRSSPNDGARTFATRSSSRRRLGSGTTRNSRRTTRRSGMRDLALPKRPSRMLAT